MAQLYELKLIPGFPGERRRRADVELVKGESLVTELTAEQLEAIEADEYITVKNADGSATAGASEPGLSELKRGELDIIAAELGLDSSKFPNKEALIAGIQDARENGVTPPAPTPALTPEELEAMSTEDLKALAVEKGLTVEDQELEEDTRKALIEAIEANQPAEE